MSSNQSAKTAARIAPKKAPAPAWRLVPVPADGLGDDPLDPEEAGLGLVDEPKAPGADPEEVGPVGMEVNETGLGVSEPVTVGERLAAKRIVINYLNMKGVCLPLAQFCC